MPTPAVLIVDDNLDLADNIAEILADEGAETAVAGSGAEALERLARRDFDLVITDMRMPGMSGVEVLRYIRERWPALPVVVMTAYARDSLLEQAAAEGALGILSKPFDLDELTSYVARVAGEVRTVLVVEDDPALRTNLMQILQEVHGLVPHTASTVAQAEHLAATARPHAAVVDIRLPDGDGLALGLSLKARYGEDFPVVYVTAHASDVSESLRSVLDSPGVTLLEKPFEVARLLELVRTVV